MASVCRTAANFSALRRVIGSVPSSLVAHRRRAGLPAGADRNMGDPIRQRPHERLHHRPLPVPLGEFPAHKLLHPGSDIPQMLGPLAPGKLILRPPWRALQRPLLEPPVFREQDQGGAPLLDRQKPPTVLATGPGITAAAQVLGIQGCTPPAFRTGTYRLLHHLRDRGSAALFPAQPPAQGLLGRSTRPYASLWVHPGSHGGLSRRNSLADQPRLLCWDTYRWTKATASSGVSHRMPP